MSNQARVAWFRKQAETKRGSIENENPSHFDFSGGIADLVVIRSGSRHHSRNNNRSDGRLGLRRARRTEVALYRAASRDAHGRPGHLRIRLSAGRVLRGIDRAERLSSAHGE